MREEYGKPMGLLDGAKGLLAKASSRGEHSAGRKASAKREQFTRFDDRGSYSGEMHDGLRDGRGCYTYNNGNIYAGQWKENKRRTRRACPRTSDPWHTP